MHQRDGKESIRLQQSKPDSRYYQSLAEDILRLDSRIFSVYIVTNPTGSVLSEAVKPEYRKELCNYVQKANGMAPLWGLLVFSILQRLDSFRSKVEYVSVGRENYKGVLFLVPSDDSIMIILTIDKKTESGGMYEMVIRFVESRKSITQ